VQTFSETDGRECAGNTKALPEGTTSLDRRKLLKNGYKPIPICGKGPRWPWRSAPITAELLTAIENDLHYADHNNTGLVTGALVGVDIDVLNPTHVQAVSAAIATVLGPSDVQRVGSKGILYLYYNAEPIKKMSIVGKRPDAHEQRNLIEFLGEGQQVAAYGIHPDTGRLYDWPNAYDGGEPLARRLNQLPEVSPQLLQLAADAAAVELAAMGYRDVRVTGVATANAASSNRHGQPVSLSWLLDALKSIPPSVKREEWLRVLWAMKEANLVPDISDEDRIELLDSWSSGAFQVSTNG
jgi:hypothetical protein